MDPVLLSDDITADTIKKILADTNQDEFASTREISFRIQKMSINIGGARRTRSSSSCIIRTLKFKIRERIIPWSVRPEIQYSSWVWVTDQREKQNKQNLWKRLCLPRGEKTEGWLLGSQLLLWIAQRPIVPNVP